MHWASFAAFKRRGADESVGPLGGTPWGLFDELKPAPLPNQMTAKFISDVLRLERFETRQVSAELRIVRLDAKTEN